MADCNTQGSMPFPSQDPSRQNFYQQDNYAYPVQPSYSNQSVMPAQRPLQTQHANTPRTPCQPTVQSSCVPKRYLDPSTRSIPRLSSRLDHGGLPSYNEAVGTQFQALNIQDEEYNLSEQRSLDPGRAPNSQVPPGSRVYPNDSFLASRTSLEHSESEDAILTQALEFTIHKAPSSAAAHRLAQPVAIPQVASGLGLPFARAYSPILQERGLSLEDFLEFIDNLNVVSTASPPLQILDLAGGIVSMVPHHIPQLVGNAVSLASKLTTAAVSKGRSTMFLKKANSDFFAPRGLKVEIATSKTLKSKIGLPQDAELVAPLAESHSMDVQQRRMRILDEHTASLAFDVPPPNEQTNILAKMSAGQVNRQIRTSEKKALKNRKKAMEKAGVPLEPCESSSSGSQQGQSKEPKVAQPEREFNKELRKIEKERAKVERESQKKHLKDRKGSKSHEIDHERDREMRKLEKETQKVHEEFQKETRKEEKDCRKEDKEIKQANKVLWIIVEDL